MTQRNQLVIQISSFCSKGFTLIEVLVVIVILGVLAALIVPKIMERPDEARAAAARQDIGAINQALKLYKLDNRGYPTTEQGLSALVKPPTIAPLASAWKSGGYLEKLPNDPWGHPYQYLSPGLHGDVDIWSLGSDNETGGEGSAADIGSWE
ncbi:MAG TPA: type II secretion system major pseudopilin GspG [Rhodocyclaceae bacterium]|nr:type II secretion system major pseudopilin GspG [Rhodocyclaceae bacterium]